jgi:hypothetical protein
MLRLQVVTTSVWTYQLGHCQSKFSLHPHLNIMVRNFILLVHHGLLYQS